MEFDSNRVTKDIFEDIEEEDQEAIKALQGMLTSELEKYMRRVCLKC